MSEPEVLHCACAILRRGDRAVLVKRAPTRLRYPGVWDLVGGHLEPGESVEEALLREAEEEVGVRPFRFRKLGAIVEPRPEVNGPHLYHVFDVTMWLGGEPRLANREHTALGWFSLAEAERLDLALDAYRDHLRQAFSGT
jgi:8-oxo-dGTP pyrophosphatase MutT (NUDIX family)